ncbi:MAG: hypothetical protein HFJ41_01655 [Clostridia bacterium]|nr:hypothetical protein [Clostridia bacterium]
MKSEKGITLTYLIIYVVLLILVVSTLSIVSTHFYSNTKYLMDNGKYVSQFDKFNMYFIEDVKNNKETYSVDENKIVFEDGTIYTYSEKSIYRNKVELCRNIENCVFSKLEETDDNNFTKKIINVKLSIAGENKFETEINYILKYW